MAEKKKPVSIIVRIPADLHRVAKKAAKKEFTSLNGLIVNAINNKCNGVAKKDLE